MILLPPFKRSPRRFPGIDNLVASFPASDKNTFREIVCCADPAVLSGGPKLPATLGASNFLREMDLECAVLPYSAFHR
jgi:hypothetical protein